MSTHLTAQLRGEECRWLNASSCVKGRAFAQRLLLLLGLMGFGIIGVSQVVAQSGTNIYAVPELDGPLGARVLPYSQIACDAYKSCDHIDLGGIGFRRDLDWKAAMQKAKVGENIVSMYERAGFSATIYVNDRSKEIVVAYRGSEDFLKAIVTPMSVGNLRAEGDWAADSRAKHLTTQTERLEAQYVAARSLASRIPEIYATSQFKDYKLTLTGHSLGGALASYAGQFSRADVYTFEPARNVLAGAGDNPRQVNVITKGDWVSDPKSAAGNLLESVDRLPGKTVSVGRLPVVKGSHDRSRIVQNIATIAARGSGGVEPRTVETPGRTNLLLALAAPQTVPPSVPGRLPVGASRPGGITLSAAAAERLPINLDLQGAAIKDGTIVLVGQQRKSSLNAALLLTTLRLACERLDPYFSLDPENGQLWNEEGAQLAEKIFQQIKEEVAPAKPNWDHVRDGLDIRIISAKRDFPKLWDRHSKQYPNFRTQLVFKPNWLRDTRYGNILYRGDLLLKELSSGGPMLQAESVVKATQIERYMSASVRRSGASLASGLRDGILAKPELEWTGFRLWFDVVPGSSNPADGLLMKHPQQIAVVRKPSKDADRLEGLLRDRGFELRSTPDLGLSDVWVDRESIDLSQIYPKMFIRVFDGAAGRDLPGSDPAANALSADINRRITQYAAAYPELEELVGAVRAYVAAVHLVKQEQRICKQLPPELLASERTESPTPAFHQSELTFTIVNYVYRSGDQRKFVGSFGRGVTGGVTLGARELVNAKTLATPVPTQITREINLELAQLPEAALWKGASGRQFMALSFGPLPTLGSSPTQLRGRPSACAGIEEGACVANSECTWVKARTSMTGLTTQAYCRTQTAPWAVERKN
ncbi:MAG: lipase family protein [Hyphomicrobiaceae bacterium]